MSILITEIIPLNSRTTNYEKNKASLSSQTTFRSCELTLFIRWRLRYIQALPGRLHFWKDWRSLAVPCITRPDFKQDTHGL